MPLKKIAPPKPIDFAYEFVDRFLDATFTNLNTFHGTYKTTGTRAYWDEILDVLDMARASAGRGAPTIEALHTAVNHWRRLQRTQIEVDTADALTYVGPSDALRQLLTAMTGSASDLYVAVLEHFIWQFKQKLHGRPVIHHMMPVFVGASGSGKSIALSKLLAPLTSLAETGVDFGIFSDERQWYMFGEKYVFLFDEMSRARKTDVESLKNTISAPEKAYRKLHTNTTVRVPQNGTFIGTSNEPVSSLIIDPTSARRFFEIKTLDKCDWEAINAIKMMEIWQSVDEEADCPVLPYLKEIYEIQNTTVRAKSNPEAWLDDAGIVTADTLTRASELYREFRKWEDEYDQRTKTSLRVFCMRLVDLPGIDRKVKADGTYYTIKLKTKAVAPRLLKVQE